MIRQSLKSLVLCDSFIPVSKEIIFLRLNKNAEPLQKYSKSLF